MYISAGKFIAPSAVCPWRYRGAGWIMRGLTFGCRVELTEMTASRARFWMFDCGSIDF